MPGRDKATLLGAGLVGGGALIMCMVNGKAPMADLPQRTIVLIMVRGLFIAVKAVGIRGRGFFAFALGARKRANTALTDCTTFHTVSTFSWGPLTLRWTLSCEDARDEVSRGRRWSSRHEVVLDSGPRSTMVLRSGGLKVRLAQGNCVGEFKGKRGGRVFGNDQR